MRSIPAIISAAVVLFVFPACTDPGTARVQSELEGFGPPIRQIPDPRVDAHAALIREGQDTFRFDTFGNEAFWGGTLKLHEAIEGAALGGLGPGVSPRAALAVGLKVDSEALPPELVQAINRGAVELDSPATTLALLELNAVVGVKATFVPGGTLDTIGIQCALCHSTVDDSFAPGIGRRRDGWANRDLNVGAIVNLVEDLTPVAQLLGTDEAMVRKVLLAWGPGKYDAALFLDGKGFRPDGRSAATLIPPAFGLAGVNQSTYTGWGSVPYWNALVAVIQMHGQGNFTDARLDNGKQFPVAARNRLGQIRVERDLVATKLAGLQAYQLSILAPPAPPNTFDPESAARGATLFASSARCASCHTDPLRTESGWNMHTPAELGIDSFQADRSPTHLYRTTPLRGLWTHQQGGYYHDGRFASLFEVVKHYESTLGFRLTGDEEQDLVSYLLSL